jgi:hypothetical protein
MSKVLLVGQAPSRSSGRATAFDGSSGKRLAKILGIPWGSFYDYFDTANLFKRWPGKHGGKYAYRDKGDRFPLGSARRSAKRLEKTFPSYPVVTFAGSRTARAFGYQVPFFTWFDRRDGGVGMVIPHPSGTNLLYHEPRTRLRTKSQVWGAIALARARLAS